VIPITFVVIYLYDSYFYTYGLSVCLNVLFKRINYIVGSVFSSYSVKDKLVQNSTDLIVG